jgi:hypothetical protein
MTFDVFESVVDCRRRVVFDVSGLALALDWRAIGQGGQLEISLSELKL